jgi:tripartite ATP-independent transporter DctP family solute receptor
MKNILLLLCSLLLLVSCRPQDDNEVYILKAGHILNASHPINLSLEFMAKRLGEKSDGRIELRLYPSSQLGNTRVLLEQTQLGVLTMVPASAAYIEGFQPELGVFSIPYIFRDREHYWQVLDGKVGLELLDNLSAVGLKGLCFFDGGARSFYTKEKHIDTPDDLKGMKIRVMANKTSIDMVKTLGGSPTPIPWGELYTALQQGVVDGAENNNPSYQTSRHYETCTFYSLDEHTRIPDMLLMSLKKWNDYPEEIRNIIAEVAHETSIFQRELWARMSAEALDDLQANGVQVHRPDKAPFVAKVEPMHATYNGTRVGELLERIKDEGRP